MKSLLKAGCILLFVIGLIMAWTGSWWGYASGGLMMILAGVGLPE